MEWKQQNALSSEAAEWKTDGCLERLGHVSCPDGVPRVEKEEVHLGGVMVAFPTQLGTCQPPSRPELRQPAFP